MARKASYVSVLVPYMFHYTLPILEGWMVAAVSFTRSTTVRQLSTNTFQLPGGLVNMPQDFVTGPVCKTPTAHL